MNAELMPQSRETEEMVIGGLLLDPQNAMTRIANFLDPHAFYDQRHRWIYEAALTAYHRNQPTDLMVVTMQLQDSDRLDRIGGTEALAQCVAKTVSSASIDLYAELLMDKWKRREVIAIAHEAIASAHEPSAISETGDVIGGTIDKLLALRTEENSTMEWVRDSVPSYIEQLYEQNAGDAAISRTLPTGYSDLDALLGGGLRIGYPTYAIGRPGMGKTSFAVELAYLMAQRGISTVFFSLEMPRRDLLDKLAARALQPTYSTQILSGHNTLQGESLDTCTDRLLSGEFMDLPLAIDDSSRMTTADMRAKLQQITAERGQVGLIVVDYVQLLKREKGTEQRDGLDRILDDLRAIAKDFNCVLFGLAQANRENEKRGDKRPTLVDFRDSDKFAQDGAACFGFYRQAYYNPDLPNHLEVIGLKNRFGATGTIKLFAQPEFCAHSQIQQAYMGAA